jgi:hypothetical protein
VPDDRRATYPSPGTAAPTHSVADLPGGGGAAVVTTSEHAAAAANDRYSIDEDVEAAEDSDSEDEGYKEVAGQAARGGADDYEDEAAEAEEGVADDDYGDADEVPGKVQLPHETAATAAATPSPAAPRALQPSGRWPAATPLLEALAGCDSLACVRDAHAQPRGAAGPFNFPHFFIAGWPKSATTTLYMHLNGHPAVLAPRTKEPQLFTQRCAVNGTRGARLRCPPAEEAEYVRGVLKLPEYVAAAGARAAFEATPGTMASSELAAPLAEALPWLKLVANLREPVSRGISKFVMKEEKERGLGCVASGRLAKCMKGTNGYANFHTYYSKDLLPWLEAYPPGQILLVQYEDLVNAENGRQASELRRVKSFLGLDPEVPENVLPLNENNCRKCRIHPEGWTMKEVVYRRIIADVLPDVLECVCLQYI